MSDPDIEIDIYIYKCFRAETLTKVWYDTKLGPRPIKMDLMPQNTTQKRSVT